MSARNRFTAVLLSFWVLGVAGQPAVADLFPFPDSLSGNVEFWKQVFGVYGRHEVLIHDSEHPERIYSILDFRREASSLSEGALRAQMRRARSHEIARIRALLKKLHTQQGNGRNLTVEEIRIRSLFAGDPARDRFLSAAGPKRIRAQTGIRERFAQAMERSRKYLPRMEQILREEGVPADLARLPFIESSFNTHAYSKVGAAGMWQFMPSTGRMFLRIDNAVDERLDPYVATRAAGRFLKQNHERLGTWPLAITAYNHGPAGMSRAVRTVGTTDIGVIVRRYRGRTFGFASRNFYAEFLAAIAVEGNHRAYFGNVPDTGPLVADEVVLDHYVPMREVATCAQHDVESLKTLNPAIRPAAVRGTVRLPRGYAVRMASGRGEGFRKCYARLSPSAKSTRQIDTTRRHRVRRGDTLSGIARRYGVSTNALRRANGLRNSNLIRIGQTLKIPGRGGTGAVASAPARASRPPGDHYRVRRGDTLSGIARRYGVSTNALRRANGIRNHHHIRVGQSLKIPGGSATTSTAADSFVRHKVRRGQTLQQIARRYGSSVKSICRTNRLRNPDEIRVGQVLRIPTS